MDTTAVDRTADQHPQSVDDVSIGRVAAVVGLQWGDEGKGKVIDLLAPRYNAVVRYNGGANAGHSVVIGGERFASHLIPCGIFHPGKLAVIGNGVVVDPFQLVHELDGLSARGIDVSGLVLSDRAHLVMPYHKSEDEIAERRLAEGPGGIGTTKRGIGPTYAEKASRSWALRAGDLKRPEALRQNLQRIVLYKNLVQAAVAPNAEPWDADDLYRQLLAAADRLAPSSRDTTSLLHDLIGKGGGVLFEGGNATLLDIDHGTFPYVTSSNCSALGIPAGSSVPGSKINGVIGVMKAYATRVGAGPFPTELNNEIGDRIRERGREFGTTTGRPRRCGWIDLVALKYSAMINGATGLSVMLLDVLEGMEELRLCVSYRREDGTQTERFLPDAAELERIEPVYETMPGFSQTVTGARTVAELPEAALAYLAKIQSFIGVPIRLISVGPDRLDTIPVGAGGVR